MPDWSSILQQLDRSGTPTPESGGDISAAWRLSGDNADLFIKTGPLSSTQMFFAEAEGLSEISRAGAVRVPEVIAAGSTDTETFLALEWIDLGPASAAVEGQLGAELAELHHTTAERYGWHRDNTLGLTPQLNDWAENWVDFFREQRLRFQLRLAAENGFSGELQERGSRLIKRLPIYFDNSEVESSLLHGDLWAGNWGCSDGSPVIFDPAVYFGDRETDLAMTRLFGGFGKDFYDAYESSWPLREGHRTRLKLYQLYHVLNHLNLFGSAYLERATGLMDELL
jgi:protein-ribulosamine 3-kinase